MIVLRLFILYILGVICFKGTQDNVPYKRLHVSLYFFYVVQNVELTKDLKSQSVYALRFFSWRLMSVLKHWTNVPQFATKKINLSPKLIVKLMWGSVIVLEILNKVLGDVHQNRTLRTVLWAFEKMRAKCFVLGFCKVKQQSIHRYMVFCTLELVP